MASTGNKMYYDFDISKVVYKDPVKNSRGGLNGYLDTSAEDRSNPRFQFPKCRTPFGISDRKSDNEFARLNLELSCDDERMLEFIKAFDAQNIKIASKNSPDWFKKQLSEQALGDTLYRWTSQEHKEGKYAPLVRVKISETGRKPTNIWIVYEDGEGKQRYRKGTSDEIVKDSHVVPIVEVGGLWFVSKGFGMTLSATDLLVYPAAKKEDFGFIGIDVQPGDAAAAPAPAPASDPEPLDGGTEDSMFE